MGGATKVFRLEVKLKRKITLTKEKNKKHEN
jgi:hypothetical protein